MKRFLILCYTFLAASIIMLMTPSAFAISFTFSNFIWKSDFMIINPDSSSPRTQTSDFGVNDQTSVNSVKPSNAWKRKERSLSQVYNKETSSLYNQTDSHVSGRFISFNISSDNNDNIRYYSHSNQKKDSPSFDARYQSFTTPLTQNEGMDMDDYYYVDDNITDDKKDTDMNSVSWNSYYYKTGTIDTIHFMDEKDNFKEDFTSDTEDLSSVIRDRDFIVFYTSDISKFVDTEKSDIEKTTHKLWKKFILLLESTGDKLRELF